MTTEIRAVEIEAELMQIKSRADGTIDIVLNVPEYCIPATKVMLDWLKDQVKCVIELNNSLKNNKEQNAISAGTKRQSEWATIQE